MVVATATTRRQLEGCAEQPWRLPAGDLESVVRRGLTGLLGDPVRVSAELGRVGASKEALRACCVELVGQLQQPESMRELLAELVATIMVDQHAIEISVDARVVAGLVGAPHPDLGVGGRICLSLPVSLKRRGHELRLVYTAPDARPADRDDRLIQLLASGRAAYDQLLAGEGARDPIRRSHLTRLARLRFLAPDIVNAILEGRQPVELTSRSLLRASELPLGWKQQREMLAVG